MTERPEYWGESPSEKGTKDNNQYRQGTKVNVLSPAKNHLTVLRSFSHVYDLGNNPLTLSV